MSQSTTETKIAVQTNNTSKDFDLINRQLEHEISPLFAQRWSPRSLTGEEIPDEVLFSAFEAARWAPSGGNLQPWRFIYSKRGSASWDKFLALLNANNQRWAEKASALILFVSKKTTIRNGEVVPSKSHSFDTGAAWQNLALQALLSGWRTRAIGGFDREKAKIELKIPDDFEAEAFVAIGKQADKEALPADFQEREVPNSRLPLKDLILDGGF
jgi:nitroreductase